MDEKTTLGPLSTESALVALLKQVDGAVANGAKLVMGGKRIDRPGSFMEPTILTDLDPHNPAFRQEFFGPVALFFRVKHEDEAVALANDSDFGLGGSVFTRDVARGERIASRKGRLGRMSSGNGSRGTAPRQDTAAKVLRRRHVQVHRISMFTHEGGTENDLLQRCDEADRRGVVLHARRYRRLCRSRDARVRLRLRAGS